MSAVFLEFISIKIWLMRATVFLAHCLQSFLVKPKEFEDFEEIKVKLKTFFHLKATRIELIQVFIELGNHVASL